MESCPTSGSLHTTQGSPAYATTTQTTTAPAGAAAPAYTSIVYAVHTTTFVTSEVVLSTITDVITPSVSYQGFPVGRTTILETLTSTEFYTTTEVITETITTILVQTTATTVQDTNSLFATSSATSGVQSKSSKNVESTSTASSSVSPIDYSTTTIHVSEPTGFAGNGAVFPGGSSAITGFASLETIIVVQPHSSAVSSELHTASSASKSSSETSMFEIGGATSAMSSPVAATSHVSEPTGYAGNGAVFPTGSSALTEYASSGTLIVVQHQSSAASSEPHTASSASEASSETSMFEVGGATSAMSSLVAVLSTSSIEPTSSTSSLPSLQASSSTALSASGLPSSLSFSSSASQSTTDFSMSSDSLLPTLSSSASLASSSISSACPAFGTIAAAAAAPAPPEGVNVYNIAGNAPYSIAEADILSMLTFPNGFKCLDKLLILQPGTAVPAMDTFTNTFIPAFDAADLPGGVDIMVVNNPSNSLAAAWITAEYIAYAMDYANLVLNRPGTVVAWSQGNLNVQWAFKYWPSTRTNVEGRNYVGMSPDYDGTILATFLCAPISVLTGGTGVTLLDDFITDGGLASVLDAIGLSAIPTDSTGMTDPEAFRALLLSLVFSDAATNGFGISSSSSSIVLQTSTVADPLALPTTAIVPTSSSSLSVAVPTLVPLQKRAIEFGNKAAVARVLELELRKRQALVKRQNTLPGAAATLLTGILGPIANELAEIVVDPTAPIMQIFANIAKLVTDLPNFSPDVAGCNPGVWDQLYFSNFVNTLAENGGALAYVPTTTVFSITDEVVEPQGVTGESDASGFMSGSNPGVVAPSNIYIQAAGQCSVITNTLDADFPPLITHEGVLASGMGVSAAILAVQNGGTVSYDQIVATYGQTEACALISQYLTVADFLGNEATIPAALLRITVNPGTDDPDAQFVSEELPLPAYATS